MKDIYGGQKIFIEHRDCTMAIYRSVQEVIDLLEEWFQAIEDGSAQMRLPCPYGKRYSKEYVDKFIAMIDQEIAEELIKGLGLPTYHVRTGMMTKGKPIDQPADFNRLKWASREAFVQQVKELVETLYPKEDEGD